MSKKNEIILNDFKENIDISKISSRYLRIYDEITGDLKEIFAYYHERLDILFSQMNSRAKNNHYFLADDSRELLNIIEILREYQELLEKTEYGFYLIGTYQQHLNYALTFLKQYRGSQIPVNYTEVSLIKYEPIFFVNKILMSRKSEEEIKIIDPKFIGEGAYAKVFSFREPLTKKLFAIKKLNKDIVGKELERFKKEFECMNKINNPYILKAYSYNEEDNSYIMEHCDLTLKKYISTNNAKDFMTFQYRRNIAFQFLKGLRYLHSKGLLHRDISFNNILIKKYEDNFIIVKLSDFGLIKDLNLDLTRTDSEIRGTIIDDTLTNFKNYNIKNEIYAIGVVLWFIFTGKTSLKNDNSEIGKIVEKCIIRNHDERYNNVNEIIRDLSSISDIKEKL